MTLANPYRRVIVFEHLQGAVKDRNIEPGGLIGNIRYGRFTANTSRVVLDLTGPADVAQVFILPPQGSYPTRFVVDLKPTTKTRFMAGIHQPDRDPAFRLRTAQPPMTAPPRVTGKRNLVVDAGNGGIEPGPQGRSGPDDKPVPLDVGTGLDRKIK